MPVSIFSFIRALEQHFSTTKKNVDVTDVRIIFFFSFLVSAECI